MFTDRFGDSLQAATGSKKIILGTDSLDLSWVRQGNVVTYTLNGYLRSSSGNRYAYSNFLPFNHPLSLSVISSFVAQTDLKTYGDMQINGKDLVLYLPSYGNALTVRSTLTVVVKD